MQTLVNGIKMAYGDDGKGAPLVFVHGFPLSRGAWDKQRRHFRASYRVIAPDLRGLGESETAERAAIPMTQYADDLGALLRQLATGPVVMVGHSMGGYIALAFAKHHPGLLRGLVLVGTKAGGDSDETAAGRRATAEKVKTGGVNVVIDAMAPKMLSANNPDAAMAAAVRGIMAPSQTDGVIGALLGMVERADSTALLPGLKIPTLVVTGADDLLVPVAESESMATAIPGATLRVITGAGHLVAFEKPDEFNRALGAWLNSLK